MSKLLDKYFKLIIAIFCYLTFAVDLECDRDLFTWIWLLSSMLWMYGFHVDNKKKLNNERTRHKPNRQHSN